MSREDFTTHPRTYPHADLESHLSAPTQTYMNPSDMILVVDPAFIPEAQLKMLLSPEPGSANAAILTDRPFGWRPTDKSRFKIVLRSNNVMYTVCCALCGWETRPGEVAPTWEGHIVCDNCTPDDVKERMGQAYRVIDETNPGPGDAEWWAALEPYVQRWDEIR